MSNEEYKPIPKEVTGAETSMPAEHSEARSKDYKTYDIPRLTLDLTNELETKLIVPLEEARQVKAALESLEDLAKRVPIRIIKSSFSGGSGRADPHNEGPGPWAPETAIRYLELEGPEVGSLNELASSLRYLIVDFNTARKAAVSIKQQGGSGKKAFIMIPNSEENGLYVNLHKAIDKKGIIDHFEPIAQAKLDNVTQEWIPRLRSNIKSTFLKAVEILRESAANPSSWSDSSDPSTFPKDRPETLLSLAKEIEEMERHIN